jgi:hypothetical protein
MKHDAWIYVGNDLLELRDCSFDEARTWMAQKIAEHPDATSYGIEDEEFNMVWPTNA